MGLTLTTAATIEPVTVHEAKAHMRVDNNDNDALIKTYITVGRGLVENEAGGLQLINATASDGKTVPYSGRDRLVALQFAQSAADAIERARLYREMVLRMVELSSLFMVAPIGVPRLAAARHSR